MIESTFWFVLISAAAVASFFLGRRLGAVGRAFTFGSLGLALITLFFWSWLQWHPAILVRALPLSMLAYLEGVGGVPILTLILGIAWRISGGLRERAFVLAGVAVCTGYFLHGGSWMLQSTPELAFADQTHPRLRPVMQTQNYSCGAAASATALRRLGVWTTEGEMAELIQARPGTGTTMIRTLYGLSRRLEKTPWQPTLIEPDWDQLRQQTMPALVLTRPEGRKGHIITVIAIRPEVTLVADPVDGPMWLSREQFMETYAGEAVVFKLRPNVSPDYHIPQTAMVGPASQVGP